MIKLGLDVGGTSIKYGSCTVDGTVIEKHAKKTPAGQGADAVLKQIIECARELLDSSSENQDSIGIAFPAVVHNGTVYNCPNIPGFHGRTIQPELEDTLGLRVILENDANAAGLAEAKLGAGKHHPDFLYVTLGTGVGGGVIRNGAVERGPYGDAGEIGHIFVGAQVMEAVVGAPALRRAAGGLDVHEIDARVLAGEPLARQILVNAGEILGRALCSALAVLGMRVIVLGGGVSKSDLLVETARSTVESQAIPSIAENLTMVRARFQEDTGLIGACMLVE